MDAHWDTWMEAVRSVGLEHFSMARSTPQDAERKQMAAERLRRAAAEPRRLVHESHVGADIGVPIGGGRLFQIPVKL